MAFLCGGALFVLALWAAIAAMAGLSRGECSGETRPFLGSNKQAFATYGCLARDAGPLIALKKRLGIYDPAWKTVIK